MWNEPDTGKEQPSPEAIANQNVRTARIIKEIIPEARIGAFVYASGKATKFEASLAALGADAKLFTWVVYHGYTPNPDAGQGIPEAWGPIVARLAPHLKLFQGEQGSPSKRLTGYALANHDWTEWSQAKWDLRRYVGDIGHGAESSVFTIADICYRDKGIHNAKGLLATDLDMKVASEGGRRAARGVLGQPGRQGEEGQGPQDFSDGVLRDAPRDARLCGHAAEGAGVGGPDVGPRLRLPEGENQGVLRRGRFRGRAHVRLAVPPHGQVGAQASVR